MMFEMQRQCSNSGDYLAVIDIGSNSVRLVVFSGLDRVPSAVFNEKVMVGLGVSVEETGSMSEKSVEVALSTLRRFRSLCDQMEVAEVYVVATAAVRDAKNGASFVSTVKEQCNFDIEVLEGGEEAELAGLGVLSGDPIATGIVGDLGGGSLELARVKDGVVLDTISLPIGPLRLKSRFGSERRDIKKFLRESFEAIEWLAQCHGQNFYLVGGAWRNLAKLMMREQSRPLHVLHGFKSSKSDMTAYCKRLSKLESTDIPFGGSVPPRRREIIPTAALMLLELIYATKPKEVIASGYGLREGLLFKKLKSDEQDQDPFLFSCQVLAYERSRFAEHASVIFEWTRPLIKSHSKDPDLRDRLQYAVCLLSDIAWRGHPDFRAEKAVEAVLHGNFVGVSHSDRAYIAVALNQAYGASIDVPHIAPILPLLEIEEVMDARVMGAALRLAQRLSGGTVKILTVSKLRLSKTKLYLGIPQEYEDTANDVVLRRVRKLAQLVGRKAKIEFLIEK